MSKQEKPKEINLIAVGGVLLAVIAVIVAAVILYPKLQESEKPTLPTVPTTGQPTTAPTTAPQPTEPPHVHVYAEETVAPDCLSGGYTAYHCECGDSYIADEVEALDHDWADATCAAPKTCRRCLLEDGRPNGHCWDEGEVTKEETESEDGEIVFHCIACGENKTQVIPSLEHVHNYEEYVTETKSTCTEGGYTTHTCRCGDSYVSNVVEALGHGWQDATCTTPKACIVCGKFEGEALMHVWQDATCTTPKTCARCQETLGVAKGHKNAEVQGYGATCTKDGLTDGVRCKVCNEWLRTQGVIPAKGHTPITVEGHEATCTDTGLTEGAACETCGVVILRQETIPAKGHQKTTVKGYAATCTETGLTDGVRCEVCNEWLQTQEVIAATGHVPVPVEGYEATCVSAGLTDGVGCNACGCMIVEQETIPKLPHTEIVVEGYEATCVSTGLTDGVGCNACGCMIVEQEILPILPHAEVTVEGYDATYIATGLTDGVQCETCGKWVTAQTEIPMKESTIVYCANGGSGTMSQNTYLYGNSVVLAGNVYTRHGWIFKGWTTFDGDSTAMYTDKQSVKNLMPDQEGKIYLYAVWELIKSHSVEKGTIEISGNQRDENILARVTLNAREYFDVEYMIQNGYTMHITASYRANIIQMVYGTPGQLIHYVEGGDDAPYTHEVWGPEQLDISWTVARDPSTDTFELVFRSSSEGGLVAAGVTYNVENLVITIEYIQHTPELVPGRDATYTQTGLTDGLKCSVCGKWITPQQVIGIKMSTVLFNGNGGSGTINKEEYLYNTSMILPSSGFTRLGHKLIGWSTKANATSAMYSLGQTVSGLQPDAAGKIYLYAVWELLTVGEADYNTDTTGSNYRNKDIDDSDKVYDYVKLNLDRDALIAKGYKTVTVTLAFDVYEKNDGYQNFWIYSPTWKNLYSKAGKNGVESPKKDWKRHELTFTLNLSDLDTDCGFIIEWGAYGDLGSDDWELGWTHITVEAKK